MFIQHQKNKKNQEEFKNNLNVIVRGKWEHEPEGLNSITENIKMFNKAREKVVKIFDDYSTVTSKTKFKAANGRLC